MTVIAYCLAVVEQLSCHLRVQEVGFINNQNQGFTLAPLLQQVTDAWRSPEPGDGRTDLAPKA